MIAYYAVGGGLGHLTRARAALHTLFPGQQATILTDSPFANRILDYPTAPPTLPPETTELVVDAFPVGLRGELTVPPGVRATLLARSLRWSVYSPLIGEPPRFDRVFVLEQLEPAYDRYLSEISREKRPLALTDPPESAAELGGWLVVHAGPDEEIRQLVAYARDVAEMAGDTAPLTVISPRRPDALPEDVAWQDIYPAWPLFATADRVVTAGGFNAVRQLARWRSKHLILPFPRRFDDQYRRAALARAAR